METKRLKCSCKHEQQDARYGASIRIMNQTQRTSDRTNKKYYYRCTVCGLERPQ